MKSPALPLKDHEGSPPRGALAPGWGQPVLAPRLGFNPAQWPDSTDDVLEAFTTVSRRIKDLARELKCLGYFDDDHDQPRAA